MTTNIDLEKMAKKDNVPLNYIIFKNEIDKIPYIPDTYLIINSAKTHEQGTHWLAAVLKKNYILYSDSYGIEPDEDIVNYARKNNAYIIYNNYQLEDIDGINCGQLALKFLKMVNHI